MKLKFRHTSLILYACAMNTLGVYSQPGSLDPSFDSGTGANNSVFDIVLQQDQKIIVGGSYTTFNGFVNPYLNRLNTDGSLDFSFVGGSGLDGYVKTLCIQADNKIIVAGNFQNFNGVTRNGLLRLNADGTLDFSFNPGLGSNGYINALAVQSDGKIIIGGSFTSFNGSTQNRIVRLTTNGTVDATFVTGNGFNGEVTALEIQADGKILVGGGFSSYNISQPIYTIARLHTDGSIDSGFYSWAWYTGDPRSIVLQPDGKILMAGVSTGSSPLLRRLNSDGTTDATFLPEFMSGSIGSLALQNDGKVLIGGQFSYFPDNDASYNLARLNTNGTFDQVFDVGVGSNDDINTTNDDIYTISIQNDNRILIGGYFTQYNTVSNNRITRLMHCSPSSSIQQIEACSQYTWIDGVTYTNSTNTPMFVLPNNAGCDSTITLHLTVNQPSTATLNETACDSFTLNNQTYTQSGTYAQQLSSIAGCDSTIVLNLTIPVINTSVSQNQFTLTSLASAGTYQWIDCGTMTELAGETSQTFTATQDGSYAVIVSDNGCSDTSECITVDVLGLQQYNDQMELLIYPNPSTGYFKGEFSAPIKEQTEIIVLDQTGRIVARQSIPAQTKMFVLNLRSLQSGVYSLRLSSPTGSCVKRLILD